MIWVVSKSVCESQQELENRHKYIEDVTNTRVSPWTEYVCPTKILGVFKTKLYYYKCKSDKGEYGTVITAHIDEVAAIINSVIERKRAIVVINSCELEKGGSQKYLSIVTDKNRQSELFFAKQEITDKGYLVNFVDNFGSFGFRTTFSERELFRYRLSGLASAIRKAYDKVIIKKQQ